MKLFMILFLVSAVSAEPTYIEQVQTRGELGADIQDIAYGNGMYIAVEREGSGEPPRVFASEDARNWTVAHELEDATIQGVKFLNGTFYIFGRWVDMEDMYKPYYSTIWTSTNGFGWSEAFSEIVEGSPQFGVMDITYGDGRFVAAINEHLYISSGGIGAFDKVTDSDQFGLQKVAYGNGIFVGLNTISRSWAINRAYSTDGAVWTTIDEQPVADDLRFINNHFVTLSSSGMSISYNGIDWQEIPQGRGTSIAYGNGIYMFPEKFTHTVTRYSTELEKNISKIYRKNFDTPGVNYSNIRGIAAGDEGFVMAGAAGIFYAPYIQSDNYPLVSGTDVVTLHLNEPFEYTVQTSGFHPDRLRTNLETGVDLPPGISRNTTSWGVPLSEEAPHISGTPTETGDWPVILFVYEDGLGEMNRYVKRKITFRVVEATEDDDEEIVLQSPVLRKPEHESANLGTTVTFTWSPVLHAEDYELQVSTSDNFESLLSKSSTTYKKIPDGPEDKATLTLTKPGSWTAAQTLENLDYDTRYYWRVRAVTDEVLSEWSERRNFTTAGPPVTATVATVSPINETADIPLPAVMEWNELEQADYYDLQLSESRSFEHAQIVQHFEGTRYEFPDLKDATTYYWKVRATIENQTTNWSPVWSFTTELRIPEIPNWEPCHGQENVTTTPKLVWNASRRAETYHLQLSDDPDFTKMLIDMESIESLEHQVAGELMKGTTYYWRVRAGNSSGYSSWSDRRHFTTALPTATEMESIPTDFKLHQNHPNPFNPVTQIHYSVPERAHVRLDVYNALGQHIASLVNEIKTPGTHQAIYDATGQSSGIYLYRFQTTVYEQTLQMTLLK